MAEHDRINEWIQRLSEAQRRAALQRAAVATEALWDRWHIEVIPALRRDWRQFINEHGYSLAELDEFSEALTRWNTLGLLAAAEGHIALAETLYEALLSEMRESEEHVGRIHKGTPLHQLGWVRLMSGRLAAAEHYFRAALLEDWIATDGSEASGLPDWRGTPAADALREVYGYTEIALTELVELAKNPSPRRDVLRQAVLLDSEMILLASRLRSPSTGRTLPDDV